MSERLERMMKRLEGDGPVEKQIILLKLTEALEQAPEFGDKGTFGVRVKLLVRLCVNVLGNKEFRTLDCLSSYAQNNEIIRVR